MDDWDLVGGDPAPGDDVEATSLGWLFDGVANIANGAKVSLVGIRDQSGDAIWKGEAAREFQERIEELPEHLTKLHDSYAKASEALRTFGSDLDALQDRASTQLNNAEYADAEVTRLQRQQETEAALIGPTEAPAPGSASCVTELQAARNLLTSAQNQVQAIRDEMAVAEDRCIEGLTAGQDLGMRNRSFLAEICEFVGDVCDILAVVLTIMAIVIVVMLFFCTPLGIFGALACIGPLMALCTALSVISLGTMVARRALGDEVSWKDLVGAAVLLLAPAGLSQLSRGALRFFGYSGRVNAINQSVSTLYQHGVGDDVVRGLTNGGSRVTRAADNVAAQAGAIPVLSDLRHLSSSFGAGGHGVSGAARVQRSTYIYIMSDGRNFDVMSAGLDLGGNVVATTMLLIEFFEPSPSLSPLDLPTPIPSTGPSDGPSTHNFPIPARAR